jgi:exodeoxyribonuclease III
LRILCLNVRSGGGARWDSILEFVHARDPDVVIFTEWRRSVSSNRAEAWAASRHMRWACANDGATRNGVLLAANVEFECVSVTPGNESAGTLLRARLEGWTVLACYFPQGDAKGRYFDMSRDVARGCADNPFLMIGDLNTGNQVADETPEGVQYACSERFDRLSSADGLVDLWRLANGPHAREWTWRTSKNGFRIDHAFGNAAFIQHFRPSCRYDHAPREAGFSDHSALLLEMAEGHLK